MKILTEYLTFHTKTHRAYVHITPQVEEIVRKSGVKEGMVLVSAMHITAAWPWIRFRGQPLAVALLISDAWYNRATISMLVIHQCSGFKPVGTRSNG